ncbi:DUF2863 family protein [Azoarcus taiwanensis]|uniref:DUF2863 family protein n=1 Tax=Azoarcus taiwanensis TaxID=666964 RepID=A0A972JA37_9RHOO|nr:DUF2863 family protein [Azoarcus taiwanensis]NMG03610.1 DUF2863 family protein [Azoarcus taiwanensis]
MKRTRHKRRGGLSRETEALMRMAIGLSESGCRAEDQHWERRLTVAIDDMLRAQDEDGLNAALDTLHAQHPQAYEELADFIESRAECASGISEDHEILLIGAPVLAWSRYKIPASTIVPAVLSNLRVHLQAHIVAENARIALADFLFSPDQLPQGYCATAEFAAALGRAALEGHDLHIATEGLPETAQFLSDTRYLLAAVAVPRGEPLFAWQEEGSNRDSAFTRWRNQGGACLAPIMPGCATEVVLPEAYFAASRHADSHSRPYSIRASVAFLGAELDTPAASLRAVIAPFHDEKLEEYRIGFSVRDREQVVHGVVWPLLGAEDEHSDIPLQIESVLRDCGVTDIVNQEHRFPLEYCDDCGAPMYPSAEGETVHAEMPESHGENTPRHLH